MYNEKVIILTLYIPFVEVDSYYGYIVTICCQIIFIYLGVNGISAADMGFMTLVVHVTGFADILENAIKELDKQLVSCNKNDQQITKMVKDISKIHQDLLKYTKNLDRNYYVICFVQIFTSVSCLTITLFLITVERNWIPGYGFFLSTFFQLVQYCALGSIILVTNDKVIIAIYDSFWYRMNISEQKIFGIMLHKAQNPVELTVGGFAPLNIQTFVEVNYRIFLKKN